MKREVKTFGLARKRDLPAVEGTPKVCKRCDLWFLAGPYERVCSGCQTPSERSKRAAKAITFGAPNLSEKPQVSAAIKALGIAHLVRAHVRATREGRQGCSSDCKWCGYGQVIGA